MRERKEEACWDLSEIGNASWHVLKQLPLLNINFHDLSAHEIPLLNVNFHDLSVCEAGHRYRVSSAFNGRVEDGAVCSLIVSSYLFYSYPPN